GTVPAPEHPTLRLVQGGAPATDLPPRSVRRRAATRRTPRQRHPAGDPIAAVLERLDEEPAVDGRKTATSTVDTCTVDSETSDRADGAPEPPGEPVLVEKTAPSRRVKTRPRRRTVHRPE